MATAKPISSSCQSIATVTNSVASLNACSLGAVGGVSSCGTRHTGASHYVNGTGSLGRLKYHHKHKSLDASDEDLDYSQLSQSTHILGRYKSDRFLSSKPDEDRRRRTIIIEKKHESYGFTLQSYGIHYKRDEEVEMLTYVDYVEYDGPAYRAGMREGDVILAINGADMEKADHKTIVGFIKNCDTRMRMVVLFEDCVKKVDLHMRYIQLQNMLQSKMNELERVCLRERELLEGKWKTHSLPARKKAITSPSDAESGNSPGDIDVPAVAYFRPTLSTEDVAHIARLQQAAGTQPTIIPPPAQFMLTYHYLDPTYRYVLRPATSSSSTEYIMTDGLQRSPSEQHFILQRADSMETTTASQATQYHSQQQQRQPSVSTATATGKPPAPPPRTCEKHKPPASKVQQQQQQQSTKIESTPQKLHKSSGKHCHGGHSCNPCVGHFRWKSAEKAAAAAAAAAADGSGVNNGNGDNVSLEAYDLASPCCDTHCVPSRRRTRAHKEHTHKHKHRDRERREEQRTARNKSQTHASPSAANGGVTSGRHIHHHHHHNHRQQQLLQTQTQPQSQSQSQSQHQHQHSHHHHTQKHPCDSHAGSIRSRYFDLASGLASHCSLHSCTSSEFAPADSTSYTTSISTDTLFWDPKSDATAAAQSRQHSTKSRQSYEQPTQDQSHGQAQAQPQQHHINHSLYQQRYHITATQVQPSQIYPNAAYVHKPKSWDNLATKAIGGYGFGYGYLDTVAVQPAVNQIQIAQQRHSMPRRNPYGRYSTYGDVENYAPPPSEFVGELTTTTTTTIMAKSTEELLASCDCVKQQQQQALKAAQYQLSQSQKLSHQNSCQMGYYSHLPRPTVDVGTSTSVTSVAANQQPMQAHANTNGGAGASGGAASGAVAGASTGAADLSTVTEVTRL